MRCFNQCSEHGTCIPPGVCACRAPWRGYDCREPLDSGSTSEDTGFLYVYSPPNELGLSAVRRAYGLDALYSAEIHFFERLMTDWTVRTLDPRRASLFYVPTWLLPLYSNTVYDKGVAHQRNLISAVAGESELFAASWRANRSQHVFFLSGDKGACLWQRGPIYLSHWGLTTPWKAMMLPQLWRSDALVSARAHEPACADGRDIILPPVVAHERPDCCCCCA